MPPQPQCGRALLVRPGISIHLTPASFATPQRSCRTPPALQRGRLKKLYPTDSCPLFRPHRACSCCMPSAPPCGATLTKCGRARSAMCCTALRCSTSTQVRTVSSALATRRAWVLAQQRSNVLRGFRLFSFSPAATATAGDAQQGAPPCSRAHRPAAG